VANTEFCIAIRKQCGRAVKASSSANAEPRDAFRITFLQGTSLKKLCSRFFSTDVRLYSLNGQVALLTSQWKKCNTVKGEFLTQQLQKNALCPHFKLLHFCRLGLKLFHIKL